MISRAPTNAVGYCVKRRIRKAPTMACSEAPIPILAASTVVFRIDAVLVVSREVRRLIKNDPSKMPGQTRYPNSRVPAKAMPDAGHTAVAYPGGIVNNSPSLPTT